MVLGPILAFTAYRTTVLVAGGTIACPKCTKAREVKDQTRGWPARMFCSHCGTTFYASRLSRAAPGGAPKAPPRALAQAGRRAQNE